jgi:pilus assembly protein CpaF
MMKPFGRRIEVEPTPQLAPPSRRQPIAVAPQDFGLKLRLRAKIMEQLDSGAVAEMPPEVLRAELEPVIHQIADKERVQLSARDQEQLAQELTDDMVGFGPLEPLLRDDTINDIMVNGPDTV